MTELGQAPSPLLLAALLGAFAVPLAAQTTHPAYSEPDTNETLMDRSDLGNVAQTGRLLYADGLREVQRAAKLEKKLEKLEGGKRASTEKKIAAARESAVAKLTEAIRVSPKMIEAYSALGDAFDLLGQQQQRLQVHAAALKVAPGDETNFRGWASALLELDQLADATRAWDDFESTDPSKAEILMAELRSWLERHRQQPGEVAAADLQRLADWLAERS